MAAKCREEVVGKRFLSVSGFTKIKSGKISEWGWRAGVIRAATHKDNKHPELQVLVEYDDVEWQRREWINIYKDKLFHLFMVEQGLAWARRRDPFAISNTAALWPALTFSPLVSTVEMTTQLQPVEFLLDRELAFKDVKRLRPFQGWDPTLPGVRDYPELTQAAKSWLVQQDGQRILLTTPHVLLGYRVEVYRVEGTTQWYTAVLVAYNEATRDLTVMDDTVLEGHVEDPGLVEMRVIPDEVVESIMRGENGITPRRSRSSVLQTQHQLQSSSRVLRGLSGVTSGTGPVGRKQQRSGKVAVCQDSGTATAITTTTTTTTATNNNNDSFSSNHPDKGTSLKTRKRKTSDSDHSSTKTAHRPDFDNTSEDLENKRNRKKNLYNRRSKKKKVLEEATNSKLREVEIRVEDCLQTVSHSIALSSICRRSPPVVDESVAACKPAEDDSALDDTSNSSSVQLVPVEVLSAASNATSSGRPDSMPGSSAVSCEVVSEEDDCVIVAQRTITPKAEERECSSRGDDDGPLSSSSPFSRMELSDSANASLRFPDDRSDSGVSSLRSSSGDERSGSRSSALSSTDEPQHNPQNSNSSTNRSPLFIPAGSHSFSTPASSSAAEPVRVWRDPNLLLESEPHVRHIHSVQHQSLLMSHPSTPAASGPPPTSAASHPASLYPPVPPPTLMSPHPLPHHHLAPPPSLYPHPHHLTDILWKQRYPLPVTAAHLLTQPGGHPTEEMLERERNALLQDRDRHERMIRERQNEVREQHKEKERLERDRQEREKMEREREREREKQERERELEKERQEQAQALHNHFEKSLRAAQQKREQWNPITGRPPQSRTTVSSEEERKRAEQEQHQREQRHLAVRSERDPNRPYYPTCQRSPNIPGKGDYPPPPAHSRAPTSKSSDKGQSAMHSGLQKTDLNMFGYPAVCQPFFPHEPKNKSDHHKSSQSSGLVVTKGGTQLERDVLTNPSSMMGEMKNSVIVKHDGKNSHHLEPRVSIAHSPSPKLRTEMMSSHYLTSANQPKASLYEYRSPTQSPHHLSHTPSPHHHMEPQNLGKATHHRQASQLPSPHHQQQSPHHPHSQQHPSPELRYRSSSESQAMIYPTSGKGNYPFLPNATTAYSLSQSSVANSKPKVSSPAPHHIYGKPSAGIMSGVPVTRGHETNPGMKMTSKLPLSSSVSPSPYQQVSQYHPPHPQVTPTMTCPPPAHSRTTPSEPRYDRMYPAGAVPGGLSVKVSVQHGTSPPTAASAPLPVSRSHPQYIPGVTLPSQSLSGAHSVQTQPLDLGVSSNKYDASASISPKRKGTPVSSAPSPVCLEVKKRRIDPPTVSSQPTIPIYVGSGQPPQLARVSEPSPLIASAATTITTVVNTAAYRTCSTTSVTSNSPSSLTDSLPEVSVTAVSANVESAVRPASVGMTVGSMFETMPDWLGSVRSAGQSGIEPSGRPASGGVTVDSMYERPPQGQSPAGVEPHQNRVLPGVDGVFGLVPEVSVGAPTPLTVQSEAESPGTPLKMTITPSSVDSEKSNSPGPNKSSSSYPVRHLKKAWLQRHTGEDMEDNSGVTGTGTCVTLPINIGMSSNNKENPMHSIHSIGSMAVNSISKPKHFSNKTASRKAPSKDSTMNGHPTDPGKGGGGGGGVAADDSSSSDQDRGRKSPPKRKPPKVKRKKGSASSSSSSKKPPEDKKRKTVVGQSVPVSESGSESDKESGSEKDSDSGASTTTLASSTGKKSGSNSTGSSKEPRKRGRRPKSSKDDGKGGGNSDEPRPKKSKDDVPPQRDPFRKPPVGQLKKTGESFLQDGPCFEVAPKLGKCRECRWTPHQRSKNMPNIFCRFYAFRRLRYTKNGQLAIAGFSDPHKDALEDDLKLWLPNSDAPPSDLDLETSRFILKQVGDHFCDLFLQEKEAHAEYIADDDTATVAWKRVVQGVREMCDVCETTLFNFHWACGKCGFVVCLDCYKSRKNGSIKIWGEPGKDRDEFSWLLCTNRQAHEQEKLMLTQIIAGDSLAQLGKLTHEMRELWNIEQFCACPASKEVVKQSNNVMYKEIIKKILTESKVNGIKKELKDEPDSKPVNGVAKDERTSPLSWLANVALSNEDKKEDNNSTSDSDEGSFSTLRDLLIRPSHKLYGSRATSPVSTQKNNKKANASKIDTLDEVISSVIEDSVPKAEVVSDVKFELKHFLRRYNWQAKGRAPLPIRIMTLTESKLLYPEVPHSWLCDGKLLRLSDSTHKENYKIFQDQWKRGQPVIVSDVTRNLSRDLWHPDAFARDFGDEKNDLINCMTGNLVPNQPMRKFWEGFDHFSKRLKDDRGNPMLLKLKDWPPGEDFAEMLPSRFTDLMKVLPLSEYTHRTGRLNLASRLPDCFVRPDLGPKMYNAYGSALHPSKGTTNLHLDISDAVNVMVYVGIPKDGDTDEHIKEAFRAIDEAGCDILTRRRVRDKGELPGALWHIYNARDADKIRDLLNKVVVEKGGRLEPHHDPIHDQSCYLDGPLRERLYKEYGVEGYAIVQCLGDAVFIPAGAPHQVRNLHNCIKVAEDFVSPENVSHCFHLTQEFRDLSDTHTNHEDKLQIKNIIYHGVKDALSCITSVLNKHIGNTAATAAADKEPPEQQRNGAAGSAGNGGDGHQTTIMDSSETA